MILSNPSQKVSIRYPATAGYLAYLKAMLRWANAAGKLDKVTVVKVPTRKKRDQFLEPHEVEALIAELDPWRRKIVMFGVNTGLRKTAQTTPELVCATGLDIKQ